MEFAVNMPEQEPQDGQHFCSISVSFLASIFPALYAPTPSKAETRESFFLPMMPALIAPPETRIVGIFKRAAAIKRPGTFLSQLGTMTKASKAWAIAIASVLSAISSRLTREYFMPSCPIAIPSQTAIAGKTIGTPPARATPCLTASTILSRFICPGTMSFWELTIPMRGFWISSSVNPSA